MDIAEIVDLGDAAAPHSVALLLHPGDLQDMLKYRYAAG